jgi:hypothetical protein
MCSKEWRINFHNVCRGMTDKPPTIHIVISGWNGVKIMKFLSYVLSVSVSIFGHVLVYVRTYTRVRAVPPHSFYSREDVLSLWLSFRSVEILRVHSPYSLGNLGRSVSTEREYLLIPDRFLACAPVTAPLVSILVDTQHFKVGRWTLGHGDLRVAWETPLCHSWPLLQGGVYSKILLINTSLSQPPVQKQKRMGLGMVISP